MKNIKIILSLFLLNIALITAAGDGKEKKGENGSIETAKKIKNLLLSSGYASENNIEGTYKIVYKVDENNRVFISKVSGESENMKKHIYSQLHGKKMGESDSHELQTLTLIYRIH